MKRRNTSVVQKVNPESWNYHQRSLVVHRHYQDLFEANIRFNGDDVFPCNHRTFALSIGREEVNRLYAKISKDEKDKHRQH
jgi:hypothetical protein